MYKILTFIGIFFISVTLIGQELNCKIIVNAERLTGSSTQVFKTLEKSLNEFVNQRAWTDKTYLPHERIECSMVFNISKEIGEGTYKGTLQVQSSRPVYNSIYTTPVFNFQDKYLTFTYHEFEPLRYDETSYQSELISIVSYYAYVILGMDADTFELFGGDPYYETAQRITNLVEDPTNKPGWDTDLSKNNRYRLITELLSRDNRIYRQTMYKYHRKGLDVMESDLKKGKNEIYTAIKDMKGIYNRNMTSHILRVFTDAKEDEIVQIFTGGPQVNTVDLVEVLNKIAPTKSNKWSQIK